MKKILSILICAVLLTSFASSPLKASANTAQNEQLIALLMQMITMLQAQLAVMVSNQQGHPDDNTLPQFPMPTVKLYIDGQHGSITKGPGYATFKWQSTNSDYCTASGDVENWKGPKPTHGTETVWIGNEKYGKTTYTITCGASSGKVDSASDSILVTFDYSEPETLTFDFLSPSGEEKFFFGDKILVSYSGGKNGKTYEINLLDDSNGTSYPLGTIINNSASRHSKSFIIPDIPSGTYSVMISAISSDGKESIIYSKSNTFFVSSKILSNETKALMEEIKAMQATEKIHFLAPGGGESFKVGDTIAVSFEGGSVGKTFVINLLRMNGNVTYPLGTITAKATDKNYKYFTIPSVPSGTYSVLISGVSSDGKDAVNYDKSDIFSITSKDLSYDYTDTRMTFFDGKESLVGKQTYAIGDSVTWTVRIENNPTKNRICLGLTQDDINFVQFPMGQNECTIVNSNEYVPFNGLIPSYGMSSGRYHLRAELYDVDAWNGGYGFPRATGYSSDFNITASSETIAPSITSLSPTSGPTGTVAHIFGTGFLTSNDIYLDGKFIEIKLSSGNPQELRFTIPSYFPQACTSGLACTQSLSLINPGVHLILVKNQNGTSNPMPFTVTGGMMYGDPQQTFSASLTTPICLSLLTNMHRGAESTDVTKLQSFLLQKGYFTGETSSFYGDKTVEAVKSYQVSKSLPQTGMVYDFTRAVIKGETCVQ